MNLGRVKCPMIIYIKTFGVILFHMENHMVFCDLECNTICNVSTVVDIDSYLSSKTERLQVLLLAESLKNEI